METKIQTLGTLHARSFSVDLDEVRRPSGAIGRRVIIQHPSAVVIVPVIEPDQTLVVRQYRYALARETIEFPAGKLDPGENPLTAANRELMEETGYRAGCLELVLPFAPSIGYSTEIIHVCLARDLEPTERIPDDDEIVRVEKIPLSRLKELILAGQLIDGTTILALAVWEWLEAGKRP